MARLRTRQDGAVTDARTPQILDLSLRVGEMLLSNGAGAADVTATMGSIAHHHGLRQAQVDVTFTSLSISHTDGPEAATFTAARQVTHRETDFDDLTRVDQLVSDLLADEIDLDEARSQLAAITSTGHHTPRWAITLAWAVTGAGIALLLGGYLLVCVLAGLASGGVEIIQRRLGRLRLPSFYSQIAGGTFVALIAVGAAAAELPVQPSRVVVTGIVMMLAGLGFIGAFQDALTGFYVTACARLLEVMMSTAGVIAGVALGLTIGHQLGVDVATTATSGLADLPIATIGGAITAGGFAFAAYAPLRSVLPIAAVGAAATALYVAISERGVDPAWPSGAAAVLIGLLGYGVARRVSVPPLVVVTAGIVPLLPGLAIYRGMNQLADDNYVGLVSLVGAVGAAVALSSGVLLGEYVAQPLRREARRLESRLAGPRLVGPLLARTRRKRD